MLDRRSVLKSGVAAAALTTIAAPFARAADMAPSASLSALFDAFMKENLDLSPIGATFLGADVGDRAQQRGQIDDNSLAGYAKQKAVTADQLRQIQAFDAKPLTGMDAINYEVIEYGLDTQNAENQRYDYGGTGAGAPYIISQLTGFYQQFPDFLTSQQPVENKADADYYMERLDGVALALDRDSDATRHDVAEGVIPPDFALDKTLTQMGVLRGTPAEKSVMVDAIASKTKALNIPGDWRRAPPRSFPTRSIRRSTARSHSSRTCAPRQRTMRASGSCPKAISITPTA